MGALAFLVTAMMAAAATADRLPLPVLEPEHMEHGSIHDPEHLPRFHGPEHDHHEPVREHKVPDPLDPIKLPPVIPNDMSKPILILGKLPMGSPPYPFSPFDDGTCSMAHLQWPCPKTCSLEWNPVYAANVEEKRVVTFINCCAWRWHVCHYKKNLTYLGRGNPNPCPKEKPTGWPKDWPKEWQNNWPKEWPKDLPKEWAKDWPKEWHKN
ncbi:uncharacterized protein LOC126267416 [Schistocerca gregaria]|uniref:uncharacterized protein LOC126267416 n=1 Tax=Schistocerca gregaria TaxID=7010 RepID=UPI00211F39E1|nr:uncharacterized protein LOC126267416 [Schistocerca gregaria]